jgi:hypothetical protein
MSTSQPRPGLVGHPPPARPSAGSKSRPQPLPTRSSTSDQSASGKSSTAPGASSSTTSTSEGPQMPPLQLADAIAAIISPGLIPPQTLDRISGRKRLRSAFALLDPTATPSEDALELIDDILMKTVQDTTELAAEITKTRYAISFSDPKSIVAPSLSQDGSPMISLADIQAAYREIYPSVLPPLAAVSVKQKSLPASLNAKPSAVNDGKSRVVSTVSSTPQVPPAASGHVMKRK